MTDKLSFTELAILAMKMADQPMTPAQLWQYALDNNLHYHLKAFDSTTQTFQGKTPAATFHARICTDEVNFQEIPNTKPKQYILKTPDVLADKVNEIDIIQDVNISNDKKKFSYHERDLHPVLCYFLKNNEYFGAYSRTIFHEESFKGVRGEDKWLYPDMVAVNF